MKSSSTNLKHVVSYSLSESPSKFAELRVSTVGDSSELCYQIVNAFNLNLTKWKKVMLPNLPKSLAEFEYRKCFIDYVKEVLAEGGYKAFITTKAVRW